MIEKRPALTLLSHLVLILGVAIVAFPLYLTLIASTQTAQQINQSVPMSLVPGGHGWATWQLALLGGETSVGSKIPPALPMLATSLVSALSISVGKIVISLLSAFAIVYFRFPLRTLVFWMVFVTLMLPVEVRIYPTYKVAADLSLLDTYAGLALPLIASATATLLFRQFFLTVPNELVEASRIDGAGPVRFFLDTLYPNEDEIDMEAKRPMLQLITQIYLDGVGQRTKTANGTAWGLVNAVTRMVDHERTAKSRDSRLQSAWFGSGARLKKAALDNALALL